MRIKVETLEDKQKRLSEWHDWFAWRPVRIDKEIVWLEIIQRSAIIREYDKPYWKWFYKNKENTIKCTHDCNQGRSCTCTVKKAICEYFGSK